ncbi:hypothetical protein PV327_005126 [Microctonus hyperodae]|uniref:Uncharacterized protein n=1 Tax=Microctonus hyperodae TaxID=165561 RepID=A0AA39G127_MICHY|nr:hypothetical protein PV327_005126 [Microctonus hyperodae]
MPRLKTDNIERDRGRANREAIRLPLGCHNEQHPTFRCFDVPVLRENSLSQSGLIVINNNCIPIIYINEGVVRASRVIGSYCDVVEPLRGPRSYPIVGRSIVRTPGVISTTAHGLAGSPSDDEISGRWCDLRRHPARRGGGGGSGGSGGSGGGFGTERLLLDSEEENDDGEDEDEAEEEEEVVEEEAAAEVRLDLPAMSRQPRVIGERELSRDLRESRDPRDHRDSRDSDHIVRTKYRDQDYNYDTHNSATPAVTASSGHTANPKQK